jgi:hypothetical protein
MKKVLNVTLAITIDTDISNVGAIIDNLSFDINEESENVSVLDHEVIDFFEVLL